MDDAVTLVTFVTPEEADELAPDMKRCRFSDEQIIGIIKDRAGDAQTADVCRKHGISSATFYKGKAKYGGMEVSEAKRLWPSSTG